MSTPSAPISGPCLLCGKQTDHFVRLPVRDDDGRRLGTVSLLCHGDCLQQAGPQEIRTKMGVLEIPSIMKEPPAHA